MNKKRHVIPFEFELCKSVSGKSWMTIYSEAIPLKHFEYSWYWLAKIRFWIEKLKNKPVAIIFIEHVSGIYRVKTTYRVTIYGTRKLDFLIEKDTNSNFNYVIEEMLED